MADEGDTADQEEASRQGRDQSEDDQNSPETSKHCKKYNKATISSAPDCIHSMENVLDAEEPTI